MIRRLALFLALITIGFAAGHAGAAAKPQKAKAPTTAVREQIPNRAQDPYLGAIVIDAASGQVLFEKNADLVGYPASVVKLMDIYIILERISKGQMTLADKVLVTAEASKIGGSQVFLRENETFPVEDLLYALMIQSANDAAATLAIHIAGSRDGFVKLMNEKAAELRLESTRFGSVHGLPPAAGQPPDVSSARDLAALARALVTQFPGVLKYTSTQSKGFRGDSFVMRNHNHLLGVCEGCDGLKTGYFKLGGYTIVATAQRGGRRVIAVVLGSPKRETRDQTARQLLAQAFAAMPAAPATAAAAAPAQTNPPAAVARPPTPAPTPAAAPESTHAGHRRWWHSAGLVLAGGLGAGIVVFILMNRRGRDQM